MKKIILSLCFVFFVLAGAVPAQDQAAEQVRRDEVNTDDLENELNNVVSQLEALGTEFKRRLDQADGYINTMQACARNSQLFDINTGGCRNIRRVSDMYFDAFCGVVGGCNSGYVTQGAGEVDSKCYPGCNSVGQDDCCTVSFKLFKGFRCTYHRFAFCVKYIY